MCQIFQISEEGKYPSQEQVDLEEEKNQDGCGVMWFEKVKGTLMTFWEKGLTAKEGFKLLKSVPLPAAFHMRNSTIGGDDKKLTHPFPVTTERELQLSLKGHARQAIMHNGTWHAWKDIFKYRSFDKNEKIPRGPWSDSRAMAYLGEVNGIGLFDILDISDGRLLWYDAAENQGKGWCWKWGTWLKGDGYIYSAPLQTKPTTTKTIFYQGSSYAKSKDSEVSQEDSQFPKDLTQSGKFYSTDEVFKIACEIHRAAHLLKLLPAEMVMCG